LLEIYTEDTRREPLLVWFLVTGAAVGHALGGSGHVSDGDFLPGRILSKAIDFERPGGRE